MSKRSNIIEHLDLEIEIPNVSLDKFTRWLNSFIESHIHVEVTPKIKQSTLLINSNDVIAFMGYIQPDEISQIESYRLRQEVRRELERNLLKSISLDTRSHYQWCLAALRNFKFGRFIEEDKDTAS